MVFTLVIFKRCLFFIFFICTSFFFYVDFYVVHFPPFYLNALLLLISRLSHCLCRLSSSVTDWWLANVDSCAPSASAWEKKKERRKIKEQFFFFFSFRGYVLDCLWLPRGDTCIVLVVQCAYLNARERVLKKGGGGRDQSAVKVLPERRWSRLFYFISFLLFGPWTRL